MSKELRIFRTDPFDPLAQSLLVPPKAIEPPDLSDLTGPNAYFFLAERTGAALGCIALRNEGTFGLVTGFRYRADQHSGPLPDILLEQVETQARSLRLPSLKVWIDGLHASIRAALVRNGFFPDGGGSEAGPTYLYERPLAGSNGRKTPPRLSV